MDLCADQLLAHLPAGARGIDIAPPFRSLFGRVPGAGRRGFNADRLANRHLLLPEHVRSLTCDADFVHIADHSYAHLTLALPPGRAGVYCHDLDCFRCLLEPARDPRPWWFRAVTRRILNGLKRAAVVFHSTADVRRELLRFGLCPDARLVHAPYGVAAEFTADADASGVTADPYLLHVGGDMPRKRLDVLLEVFAEVRRSIPALKLIQIGPPWSSERSRQLAQLRIADAVVKRSDISRAALAQLYRRAAVVLVPSEAEGFGLPVIEALACGAVVVASDIPVLREVGGPAVVFRPVAAVAEWRDAVLSALRNPTFAPPRADRLAWAARYTWSRHAAMIASAYDGLERNLITPLGENHTGSSRRLTQTDAAK